MKIHFILSFLQIACALGEKVRIEYYEFRPCDGYENSRIVFEEADIWNVDFQTAEVTATVVLEVNLDETLRGKVLLQKCPEMNEADCEDYPVRWIDDLCEQMVGGDNIWTAILMNADNRKFEGCPIPKGEYHTTDAHFNTVMEKIPFFLFGSDPGEYHIHFYYYYGETEAGCQFIDLKQTQVD